MTDYTPLLHLPEVAPNQEQKETTINTALAILEAAMNDTLAVSMVAGDVVLNQDQFTKYFLIQATGSGIGATRNLTILSTPRWFAVENQTNVTLIITTGTTGALNGELGSGHIGLFVSDGADVRAVVPDPSAGIGLLNDLANVSGVPTDGQLLRYVASTQQWTPWTLTLAFSQLSDFPGSYGSHSGMLLGVKADGSGLEWVTSAANVNDFLDLSDTPTSYSGAAGYTVKVNTGGTGLVFARPKLTEATDFPSSFAGAANKFTRVNPGATALIFDAPKVVDLSDGPGAPTIGDATHYVRVKVDGSGLEYATGTGGPQAFTELNDTPSAFTGAANKLVRVNAGATALAFSTLNYLDLADGPSTYTSAAGKVLKVNGAATGVTFGSISVQDLSNGPGSFTGAAKKVVRVNVAASALEYVSLAITDLQFFPNSFTGQGGKYLQVKPDESGVQFVSNSVTTSFLALTDSPDSYAGQGGKIVYVDPAETGLAFKTLPLIPTKLGQLSDVEDGTGTPAQGAFLRWIDGVWQADVSAGGSGSSTLAALTDIDFAIPPTNGQALIYDQASGKWKAGTVAGGSGGAAGAHAYWRLSFFSGQAADIGVAELEFRATTGAADQATGGTPIAGNTYTTVSGFDATKAFDNDASTFWASDGINAATYLGYHFATSVEVQEVSYQNRPSGAFGADGATGFAVQYSDDGSNWTTAWNVSTAATWTVGETRTFGAPSVAVALADLTDVDMIPPARGGEMLGWNATTKKWEPRQLVYPGKHPYWRVKINAGQTSTVALSLVELQVTPGGGPPAAVASTFGGNTAAGSTVANAFDASNATAWVTNTVTSAETYIGVQFTRPAQVRAVHLRNDHATVRGPSDFVVEWSENGTDWSPAWSETYTTWFNGSSVTFAFRSSSESATAPGITLDKLYGVDLSEAMTDGAYLKWVADGFDPTTGTWKAGILTTYPNNFRELHDVDLNYDLSLPGVGVTSGQPNYDGYGDLLVSISKDETTTVASDVRPTSLRTYPDTGAHAYWRIAVTSLNDFPAANDLLGVKYIEFRPLPNAPGHPMTAGTPFGSTPTTGHTVANGFDTNAQSYVSSVAPTTGAPIYLGYQFPAPVRVQEVMIWADEDFGPSNGNPPGAFEVQYSDDGVAYTTAYAGDSLSLYYWHFNMKHTFQGVPVAPAMSLRSLWDVPHSYESQALQVLRVKADESGLEFATNGAGGSTTLAGLADIDFTTGPTDGQLLMYDGASSKWKAAPKPTESFVIALGDEVTAIVTGANTVTFRMPYAFSLTAVRASLTTASASGVVTVDIKEGGTSILSTLLTIDASEKTSTTAATAAVISDAALADDAEITFSITTAGAGAAGLKVYLIGHQ